MTGDGPLCDVDGGELVIHDAATGAERWRGTIDGYPVAAALTVPGSSDCVVVLDQAAGPKVFANLLRVRPDGGVVWRARTPESSAPDAYVEARFESGQIIASSWSGFRCIIDPEDGSVDHADWVK